MRIQTRPEPAHKRQRRTLPFEGRSDEGRSWSHLSVGGGLRHNGRMDITLNGEPRSLATPVTVHELLQAEGLVERRVAVEVNGSIVPRGRHATHPLADGDRVEIVHALGGG